MDVSHRHARPLGMAFIAALAAALLCGSARADPPGRAGRVSALEGSATVQQGEEAPAVAVLNWPVTAGEHIATAPGSRLELRVGSMAVQLDGDSRLDIGALDDQRITMRLERGSMALHARSSELAHAITLATAQGRISPQGVGHWRIDAGLAPDTTTVAAFDAPAAFSGGADAETRVTVPAGRMVHIVGVQTVSLQTLPIDEATAFDRWIAQRDARGAASGYVSSEMTGAEDLDAYGSWSVSDAYGAVWYPDAVPVDWAPYRTGRWAWLAPWGWTWVDTAPWGFAPFHYGRWALVGERWGWVPGARVAAPVYAPAMVGWIGGRGWSLSASVGPSVGWFPLAPFEAYYPGYAVSPDYLRRLNAASVRDVTHIAVTAVPGSIHYANRDLLRAVTVVPVAAMAGGREISRVAVPVRDAKALAAWPTAARVPLEREPAAARPIPEAPHEAFEQERRREEPFGPELRARRHEFKREHERGRGER